MSDQKENKNRDHRNKVERQKTGKWIPVPEAEIQEVTTAESSALTCWITASSPVTAPQKAEGEIHIIKCDVAETSGN